MNALKLVGVANAIAGMLLFPMQSLAAQWVTNMAVTQVISGNSSGEYVQLLTSATIVNPAACSTVDSYIIRDPAILKSALAIGLTAVAAGRQIRVFVADTCDAPTGRPLVTTIGLM